VTASSLEAMDWIVIGMIPLAEVTENATRVTRLIFVTGLTCLLFGLLFAFLTYYSISRPILNLVNSITKVGLGNFNVTMKPLGNDEIGKLFSRFNKMTRQIATLMENIAEEQRMKRNYELTALQAQIYPHFLYNTLDNLAALIQMGMRDKALQMTTSLSSFYKIALSKGDSLIPLGEELKHAHNYMEIQKIRYEDDFDYTIEVDPDMHALVIPKLSIQPILENALYHGIRRKRGKGMIAVHGFTSGNIAVIRVTDNGAGMTEDLRKKLLTEESPVRSFGLKSVHDRLQLYFGNAYGIRIFSEPGKGTQVDLVFPNKKEGEGDRR